MLIGGPLPGVCPLLPWYKKAKLDTPSQFLVSVKLIVEQNIKANVCVRVG